MSKVFKWIERNWKVVRLTAWIGLLGLVAERSASIQKRVDEAHSLMQIVDLKEHFVKERGHLFDKYLKLQNENLLLRNEIMELKNEIAKRKGVDNENN